MISEWLERSGSRRTDQSRTSCATGCSAVSATGANRSRSCTTTPARSRCPTRCCRSCCPRSPISSPSPPTIPTRCRRRRCARAADWVEVELDLAGPEWAGYGDGSEGLPARDEHDAAVGGVVLVLPALPRSHERRRHGRPAGGSRVGGRHAARRLTEDRSRRPLRRWRRARGAAPLVRALLAQGAVRPRATSRRSSRSNGS